MDDEQRAILNAVAEGRMTPEEAAEALGGPAEGEGAGAGPGPGVPEAAGEVPARELRIRAVARSVRVLGDPEVAEVAVEGVHEARREGDVLVVNAHRGGEGGFAFVGPHLDRFARRAMRERERAMRDWARDRGRARAREGGRGWSWDWSREWPDRPERPDCPDPSGWRDLREWHRFAEPLVVRVNPELAVEAEMSAGSLSVSDLRGPLTVEVSAGSASLERVAGPLDVRAQAAAVRIRTRLDEGQSRVRCDAGNVSVALEPGSDVRVRASCELGRIRVHAAEEWQGKGMGSREIVIGQGRATLDVETTMGAVDVRDEAAHGPGGGWR